MLKIAKKGRKVPDVVVRSYIKEMSKGFTAVLNNGIRITFLPEDIKVRGRKLTIDGEWTYE